MGGSTSVSSNAEDEDKDENAKRIVLSMYQSGTIEVKEKKGGPQQMMGPADLRKWLFEKNPRIVYPQEKI